MPLVNGNILLDRIREKRVLAGAFNTTNLETTISILDAIERSGLPNSHHHSCFIWEYHETAA